MPPRYSPDWWSAYLRNAQLALRANPQDTEAVEATKQATEELKRMESLVESGDLGSGYLHDAPGVTPESMEAGAQDFATNLGMGAGGLALEKALVPVGVKLARYGASKMVPKLLRPPFLEKFISGVDEAGLDAGKASKLADEMSSSQKGITPKTELPEGYNPEKGKISPWESMKIDRTGADITPPPQGSGIDPRIPNAPRMGPQQGPKITPKPKLDYTGYIGF